MTNPFDLTGKKVLVTGASSGIGRNIAIYLSKLGAKIVIQGRNKEKLQQTIDLMEGNEHCFISFDFVKNNDAKILYREAISDGIKFNGLVHSAGIIPTIPLKLLTYEKITYVMKLNYYSFVEMVRQFSNPKYSSNGKIVAISSIASKQPESCQTIYSASKAAMNSAVSSLAFELEKKKININAILPGIVWTENNPLEKKELDNLLKKQLLGIIDLDSVAGMVSYLLSDLGKYITGRCLYLDGGRFR